MKPSIDHTIRNIVFESVDKIEMLSSDPNIREAILKCALRDFVWRIHEKMEGSLITSEFLTTMSELIEADVLSEG